jgi:hypothetical protein
MSSGRFNVTLTEIREQWSLDDLLDAHDVIDALEKAEASAHRKAGAR